MKKTILVLMAIFCSLLSQAQQTSNAISNPIPIINTITGIAGSGGFSGNNGPAKLAQVKGVADIAIDSKGNKYIADEQNFVVRKIDAVTGVITVFAGDQGGNAALPGATPSNNVARTAAKFKEPIAVAVDSHDNVYVADEDFSVVQKIDITTNQITVYAGNVNGIASSTSHPVGDGGNATAGYLNAPTGLAFDANDNLYIADFGTYTVRKVNANTQIITTVAGTTGTSAYGGNGGLATNASLTEPLAVVVSKTGDYLYIADDIDNVIRRVNLSTQIITDYVNVIEPQSIEFDNDNNLYIATGSDGRVLKVDKVTTAISEIVNAGAVGTTDDGNPASTSYLSTPTAIAFDKCGSLYIGDYTDFRVRIVHFNTAGSISHPVTGYFLKTATLNVNDLSNTTAYQTQSLTVKGSYYNWSPPISSSTNSYELTPTKPYVPNVTTPTQVKNGVNIADAVLIQRHVAALSLFTDPYKFIAADVNCDGMVNTVDYVKISSQSKLNYKKVKLSQA